MRNNIKQNCLFCTNIYSIYIMAVLIYDGQPYFREAQQAELTSVCADIPAQCTTPHRHTTADISLLRSACSELYINSRRF